MQIEGKVTSLSDVMQVGANNIDKQVIVVEEVGPKYPNSVCIDFIKEDVEKLAGLSVGDMVTIEFNMRISEYNGKTYNGIKGWKVTKHDDSGI